MCGFVERWNRDTNTFYMNDMSSLLHLPIMGQFSMFDKLDNSGVVPVMWELLGVPDGPANATLRDGHGNVVLLSWLREHYNTCCENKDW